MVSGVDLPCQARQALFPLIEKKNTQGSRASPLMPKFPQLLGQKG